MKKQLLILISFLLPSALFAQQNLVPNPSFEDTVYCPFQTNQINATAFWLNFGNSPDYFHACGQNGLNVPNAFTGFQYANSGQGMAGIATYVWEQSPGWPHFREYIGVELKEPLIIGEKYFISFFTNFSGYLPNWQKIAANKIGLKFSTVPYSEQNPPALTNSAHLFTNDILKDTVAWVKISGSFIADSAYNYLIVGNFFDENNTDTLIFGGPPFGGSGSYYYIDDVCVSTDSIYNETWTSIEKVNKPKSATFYPNPSNGKLKVKSGYLIEKIEVFNSIGQLVYLNQPGEITEQEINLNHLPSGSYIIRISNSIETITNKLILNNQL
jgi:hypothetical protein